MISAQVISAKLGSILIRGGSVGVGLWFFSVFGLVVSGQQIYPWPSLVTFSGRNLILGIAAWIGMLVLAATPIAMLSVFIAHSVSQKNIRSAVVGLGVMSVIFTGLFMAMMN